MSENTLKAIFKAGGTFASLEAVIGKLNAYSQKTGYELAKGHSKTLNYVNNSSSKPQQHKDKILYNEINFDCKQYGVYKPKGQGIRNRKSKKTNCPFTIRFYIDRQKKTLRVTNKCNFEHNHLPEVKAAGQAIKKLTNEPSKRSRKNLTARKSSPEFPTTPKREDKSENEDEFNEITDTDDTASSSELFDHSRRRINVSENNKIEKIIKKKKKEKTKVDLPADPPSPKVPAAPEREDESETEEFPETIEDPDDTSSLEISDHSYYRNTVPENNEKVEVTKKKKLEINKGNLPAKISTPNITRTTGTADKSYSEEGFQTWTLKPGEVEVSNMQGPKIPLFANPTRPKKRTRAIGLTSTTVNKETNLSPKKKKKKIDQELETRGKKFSSLTVEQKSSFLLSLLIKKNIKITEDRKVSLENIKKLTVKTMPHPITANRLKLIKNKLEEDVYKNIQKITKMRSDKNTWFCSKCPESISNKFATECECCFRWFCGKCGKSEEDKQKVWICAEREKMA
ncbi:hypothetical protein KQX54_007410 [Cotesia glomerata]|uniref:Uncharacterized protein n=1 Tax=Cotesia glomerata TaxID=32391 RepID=A0AAV7HUA8_COTGL|nr:hypothetical protein KQX54_007410 [Cotesia glomerata]